MENQYLTDVRQPEGYRFVLTKHGAEGGEEISAERCVDFRLPRKCLGRRRRGQFHELLNTSPARVCGYASRHVSRKEKK